MNDTVILQKRLIDLREERDLTQAAVARETRISHSTLQRIESNSEYSASYKDIAVLAKYYNVSMDYLFGLTNLRQHRNVEIDKLHISDEAVEALVSRKLNNRLVSELISHTEFQGLLSAIEVYIDRKVEAQIHSMNQMYKYAETTIKDNFDVPNNDETMKILLEMPIDNEEFLRYRISERFNQIMKGLYEIHKDEVELEQPPDYLKEIKDGVETYLSYKDNPEYGKLVVLLKQFGMNISQLSDTELNILTKTISRSKNVRKLAGRKVV